MTEMPLNTVTSEWERCVDMVRRACEAGALAAYPWVGRLDRDRADRDASRAATRAIRDSALTVGVVASEGAKDGVEHLAVGETINGSGAAAAIDFAIDAVEGTTNLANGLPWSLAVAAATPGGGMLRTGPSLYMEKLVVPAAAAARMDPEADTASRLATLADALGKPRSALRIFVLDKPRHATLVQEVVKSGARVACYPAGDVVGGCAVAMGEHFDAVFGIGGTPEGVMSACAVRALGGGFFARLRPQRQDERDAMARAGIQADRWLSVSELVPSPISVFCAIGITDSLLVPGIREEGSRSVVSSVLVEGPAAKIRRESRIFES